MLCQEEILAYFSPSSLLACCVPLCRWRLQARARLAGLLDREEPGGKRLSPAAKACWASRSPAGVSSGRKGVFSPACMYVQVLELKPHADASHSQLMMLRAPRSPGGCLKKGEASWRDPGAVK